MPLFLLGKEYPASGRFVLWRMGKSIICSPKEPLMGDHNFPINAATFYASL